MFSGTLNKISITIVHTICENEMGDGSALELQGILDVLDAVLEGEQHQMPCGGVASFVNMTTAQAWTETSLPPVPANRSDVAMNHVGAAAPCRCPSD